MVVLRGYYSIDIYIDLKENLNFYCVNTKTCRCPDEHETSFSV